VYNWNNSAIISIISNYFVLKWLFCIIRCIFFSRFGRYNVYNGYYTHYFDHYSTYSTYIYLILIKPIIFIIAIICYIAYYTFYMHYTYYLELVCRGSRRRSSSSRRRSCRGAHASNSAGCANSFTVCLTGGGKKVVDYHHKCKLHPWSCS